MQVVSPEYTTKSKRVEAKYKVQKPGAKTQGAN